MSDTNIAPSQRLRVAFRPLALVCALSGLLSPSVFAAAMSDADSERAVREAVAVARQLRQSDNEFDQIAGAGTLADVGDKDALQFLADNVSHPDWSTMRSAIDMLLAIQHPAGIDLLYRYATQNPDGVFLKFLSESLASRPRDDMGEFLMNALDLQDQWVIRYALQALQHIPVDDKQARIHKFLDEKAKDTATQAYAHLVLMDTAEREESLGALIELASIGTSEAQEAVAVALGQVNNADTQKAIAQLRKAGDLRTQIAATASAAGFGADDAIKRLIEIIAYGKGLNPSLAAASLRRMPADVALKITAVLFECCTLNSDVGTRVIESWAYIDGDATRIYQWGLNSDNAEIRMQAVWLVGTRQDKAWLERIIPMLKDPDSGVRGMAAWSIVRMLGDEYDPGVEA